jgi:glyoxylase-like metal-dependent hydrolase (beta-lactamase superfamily II)
VTRLIDLNHLGRSRVIGAFVVDGMIVDCGPGSCLDALLQGLDGEEPRGLLLTHIHLDHAGASGSLVQRFPNLPVYVHERGAKHMIDPSRLLASATRIYGDDMDRRWGEFLPVPEENVRVLTGGESIDGFRVAYTPGHAWHHVSYLYEATGDVFTGDVAGVTIPPTSFALPPTPPPDIDIEAWESSLDTLLEWSPERACITHCGAFADVPARLEQLRGTLHRFAELARTRDEEAFVDAVVEHITSLAGGDLAVVERFLQASPPHQLHAGLTRYWAKRAEVES